jgi:UDP-N-acetyl-D-mannosaminuronic acid dehydrogenase
MNFSPALSGKIDKQFRHLSAPLDASLRVAMEVIERGQERICFLIDDEGRLIRVVSDGDIRRALIRGHPLESLAKDIHDRTPVVAKINHPEQALMQLGKRITIVPVIDDEEKVVGVARLQEVPIIQNMRRRAITVVGLGYVGLTLSVILAENGFCVVGYDTNPELLEKLISKEPPFFEKGLKNLLAIHVGDNFRPTGSAEDIWADIYIITVGTPIIRETLKPNIAHIEQAVRGIADKLKLHDLVILRSTLPIGCTRNTVIPLLEKISGLTAGSDFFVAVCPERTAEGRALQELRELPQIVGGFDQQSCEMGMRFFNENTHTVIDVGSLEAAEMCKLLDNTYRDVIFAYANQMAVLSEKVGLNLKELVTKVNLGYGRNAIPFPSPGVGGPCLSKDPYILIDNFAAFGLECRVTSAARKENEAAPALIFDRCQGLLSEVGKDIRSSKVVIVGFAFKGNPETSDLRDSTTLWFLEHLKQQGVQEVWGYDPVVAEEDLRALDVRTGDISEGFKDASLALILNNHASYTDLNMNTLLNSMSKPAVFYDGWNVFNPKDIDKTPGVRFAAMGHG